MNATATSRSASAAVATSVGAVLRNSKFARFDRRLPQVYTHVNGNWGAVKAPLPAPGKLPATYLTFRALDTAFRVPDMRVADQKVSAVQRLVEQVPYVVPGKESMYPSISGDDPLRKLGDGSSPVNLAEMSKKEFREWLHTVDPSKVPVSQRANFRSALRAAVHPKASNRNPALDDKVAGPVYTKWEDVGGHPLMVQGRVLRQYSNVQSVGVSGFVMMAETGANVKSDVASRALAEYQVERLYWDRRGRAHGTLTENRNKMHAAEQRRSKAYAEAAVLRPSRDQRSKVTKMLQEVQIRP